jgi:uncharacterized Zn-finger protein
MNNLFIPTCQSDLVRFNFDISIHAGYTPPPALVSPPPALISPQSVNDFSNMSDTESSGSPSSMDSPALNEVKYAYFPASRKTIHFCKICQKLFERPSTLKTHMNSHTGERPYFCPNDSCNRSFSVRSNMNRHYRKCPYS